MIRNTFSKAIMPAWASRRRSSRRYALDLGFLEAPAQLLHPGNCRLQPGGRGRLRRCRSVRAQPFATLLSECGSTSVRRYRDPKAAAPIGERGREEAGPLSELRAAAGRPTADLGQRDEDEAEAHATQDHG